MRARGASWTPSRPRQVRGPSPQRRSSSPRRRLASCQTSPAAARSRWTGPSLRSARRRCCSSSASTTTRGSSSCCSTTCSIVRRRRAPAAGRAGARRLRPPHALSVRRCRVELVHAAASLAAAQPDRAGQLQRGGRDTWAVRAAEHAERAVRVGPRYRPVPSCAGLTQAWALAGRHARTHARGQGARRARTHARTRAGGRARRRTGREAGTHPPTHACTQVGR